MLQLKRRNRFRVARLITMLKKVGKPSAAIVLNNARVQTPVKLIQTIKTV
jgi:hypothetical protein